MAIFKRSDGDGQGKAPLLTRPAPVEPAVFDGAEVVDGYAVLRWETAYGGVGVAHFLHDGNGSVQQLVSALYERRWPRLGERYAVVAVAQAAWRVSIDRSPRLVAQDLIVDAEGKVSSSDRYEPTWGQLATVLGAPAPYWTPQLRDVETIRSWRPGVPPAVVPAVDMLTPAGALAEVAADEPDGSAAAQVCLWLARKIRRRAHQSAENHVEDLRQCAAEGMDSAHLVLGALPAPYRRGEDDQPLDETVRRAGWLEISERRDVLAHRVAHLVQIWDGGDDWHTGAFVSVIPGRCGTAREWAQRLEPVSRTQSPTVLEHVLLSNARDAVQDELLHDSVTGLPALRLKQRWEKDQPENIFTLTLQRLPTVSPLHSLILSGDAVWIRTEDGTLWFAPHMPGDGISWGYSGSGPHTLAQLLDRLLDDISAPAVDNDAPDPPQRLHQLMVSAPQDTHTTYTRAQLLDARTD